MEHMTLETEQLSMKVRSKGVPVISEKLQTMKKIPQHVVCLLNPTVGNLNSGCYWKYQITDSDTEGSSKQNRTRSQNYYSFVMRSSWCMDQIHRNVIPC